MYENSTIHISKENLLTQTFVHIFPEDSPLKHKFKWILLKMADGGISQLLYDKKNEDFLRNLDDTNEFGGSDVQDLSIGFSVVIVGWVFGIIALFIEFVSN